MRQYAGQIISYRQFVPELLASDWGKDYDS